MAYSLVAMVGSPILTETSLELCPKATRFRAIKGESLDVY